MKKIYQNLWWLLTLPFKVIRRGIDLMAGVSSGVNVGMQVVDKTLGLEAKKKQITIAGFDKDPKSLDINAKLIQDKEVETPLETDKFKKWAKTITATLSTSLLFGALGLMPLLLGFTSFPVSLMTSSTFLIAAVVSYGKNKRKEETRASQAMKAQTVWGRFKRGVYKKLPTIAMLLIGGAVGFSLLQSMGVVLPKLLCHLAIYATAGGFVLSSMAKQKKEWQEFNRQKGADFLKKEHERQLQQFTTNEKDLPKKSLFQKIWPYLECGIVLGLTAWTGMGLMAGFSTGVVPSIVGIFKIPAVLISALGFTAATTISIVADEKMKKQNANYTKTVQQNSQNNLVSTRRQNTPPNPPPIPSCSSKTTMGTFSPSQNTPATSGALRNGGAVALGTNTGANKGKSRTIPL